MFKQERTKWEGKSPKGPSPQAEKTPQPAVVAGIFAKTSNGKTVQLVRRGATTQ